MAKQKTKKQLEAELSALQFELTATQNEKILAEQREYSVRESLSKILGFVKRDRFTHTDEIDVKSWSDIKAEVAKLTGYKAKEGEVVRFYDEAVHNENAKLWYLLRVFAKDDTLKPENFRDYQTGETTPFPQPNFTR